MNRLKALVSIVGLLIAVCLLGVGSCARIGSPSGGPRDTIPPNLLRTEPTFATTGFKGTRIRMYFDEFPTVKDQEKELFVSPPLQKRVGMTVKGKSVLIDLREDSLLSNTTYRLMFGKSIVDLNEGNALEDLHYVFSTGSSIDTMKLRGAIYDAETGLPVLGTTVMAYEQHEDSLVLFGKPDKIARTDSAGVYTLQNLKAVPYRVVAVEDANGNYRYDAGSEKMGFSSLPCNPVFPTVVHKQVKHTDKAHIQKLPDSLDIDLISIFKEPNTKQFILNVERKERRAIKMIFNAPNPVIDSLQLLPLEKLDYVLQAGNSRDTLIYWLTNPAQRIPDSLVLRMNYLRTDTAERLVSFPYKTELMFREQLAAGSRKEKRFGVLSGLLSAGPDSLTMKTKTDSIAKVAHYSLTPKWIGAPIVLPPAGLGMQFSAPLVRLDTAKLRLTKLKINVKTKDTVLTEQPFRLIPDVRNLTNYGVRVQWEPNMHYILNIDSAAFHDIYGKTNPIIEQKFQTPDPEKMSSLTLTLSGLNSETGYVIDLLSETGNIVRREVVKGDQLTFSFLSAGKYKLRILEDRNRNGIQDMGSFSQKIQPERVANIGGIGVEALINLREGWEVEQAVKLNELFK